MKKGILMLMKPVLVFLILASMLFLVHSSAAASDAGDLWVAARDGDINGVRALLDRGIDVNARAKDGYTALSNAASSGHVAIVRLLIERGADVDQALYYLEDLDHYLRLRDIASPRLPGAIALLRRLQTEKEGAKRQEQEAARAQALEAQRTQQMKEMLKEAVAAASKGQAAGGKAAAVKSDIDKPEFAESQRLMGDDDLAVIIGVEGYQSLPKSDYSYDDARLVKEYARALGFKERNIELLLDEKATRSALEKTLEVWLRNKANAGSRIFIYYSGHGAPEAATGEAYLVPYDGDPNYLAVTGYPLKRLYESLRKLPATEVIVVLDACFSGAGGRSVLAKGARPLVMAAKPISLASNIAVLTATQANQISASSPEKGHGIFTYYFLRAIKEGKRNLNEIFASIRPLVEDEAKQINVQQSPSLYPAPEKLIGRFNVIK